MKITFSNLGAIKKTTLDLRPLTVIIGPNNSNKTYIAYSIYGLWKISILNFTDFLFDQLDSFIDSKENLSLKIDDKFFSLFTTFTKEINKNFHRELNTFFQDSSRKLFNQTNVDIDISDSDIRSSLNTVIKHSNDLLYQLGKSEVKLQENVLTVKFDLDESNPETIKSHHALRFMLNLCFGIMRLLFATPFLLPAERNAFIITYKMLANRRYKFLRQTQRELFSKRHEERQIELLKEQGDIRYPQPIEDFLDFLADVELENSIGNDLTEKRKEFCELADQIEETIQGKNKTNFIPTKFGGKEIQVNVRKDLDIDLYNASSSIKQLAPLLLYLRYRAKENDLLIIDEPEMNLHPESQAKLLEVLGMLVNAGVNVLLTTHSPYFMSHLNNLISGDMTDEKIREKQAKSLYLEDARAFLSPDNVSAYEMKKDRLGNQKLHDLKDKDYGIRWDTLSDVSADIQQKFFEIYEQKEESSNNEEG